MEQRRWFRCEREHMMPDDGLHHLRRVMLRLYQDGAFIRHGLISVATPTAVSGFDRLAALLDYSRLIAEMDITMCTTLTDHGPVVALWRVDSGWENDIGDLRDRLAAVCPEDPYPSVRLVRLPADITEGLDLLTELGSL